MAVPQRRISKTRKRMRRTHFKLDAKGLVKCKKCGEMIQPHKVCPHCGSYDGKLIVKSKAMKKQEIEDKKKKKEDKKAKDAKK